MAAGPAELTVQGGLPFAWAEILDEYGPTFDGSFTESDGRLVQHMQVYYDDLVDFSGSGVVANLLGYAVRDSTGFLNRVLPYSHPLQPSLLCTSISNIKPLGYDEDSQGDVSPESLRCNLTLGFTQPMYDVYSDLYGIQNQCADEGYRNLDIEMSQYLDTLSLGSSAMVFVNGTPSAGTSPGIPLTFRIKKKRIVLTWRSVPENCIFAADRLSRPNLDAIECTINAAPWHDFAPGTLYCEAIETRLKASPLIPSIWGRQVGTPSRFYDVVIKLVNAPFGWQNVPDVKNGGGNFYTVNSKADGSGSYLYQTADWTNLLLAYTGS